MCPRQSKLSEEMSEVREQGHADHVRTQALLSETWEATEQVGQTYFNSTTLVVLRIDYRKARAVAQRSDRRCLQKSRPKIVMNWARWE